MTQPRRWFVGVDWARTAHHVCVHDPDGHPVGEREFAHGGADLAAMADWLLQMTGAGPELISVAIEMPHGPVVESLLERGFSIYAINPKQLDRFRDRISPAGAKDDSRDSQVLASSLRTDPHCFRLLAPTDPVIVELREWSRIIDDLTHERTRLTNQMRDQLWRYFPALLELTDDFGAPWFLDLWECVPTPERAVHVRRLAIARILERHRIRRFDATQVLASLRQPAVRVRRGTIAAATGHIAILVAKLRLLNRQLNEADSQLDRLTALHAEQRSPGQVGEQHDVAILRSCPGIGRRVHAILLAEASDPLQRRDYHALRCLCGAAPVTRRSGTSRRVTRRLAYHPRLSTAVYHWARVATQHDPVSRLKYKALRQRGQSHGRALRSVADRLLKVLCTMLRNGTLFQPSLSSQNHAC
jgi:transposase